MTSRTPRTLRFKVLPGEFAVAQLNNSRELNNLLTSGEWVSVTRTQEELSVICSKHLLSDAPEVSEGWALLRLQGPFAFDEIGIMNVVTDLLAQAAVPLLAVSTFETDYFLVPDARLEEAVETLEKGGLQKLS